MSVTTPEECEAIGEWWDDGEYWCEIHDPAKYLPTKAVCETWRSSIDNDDYRDSVVCYEDGGAECGGSWYFDANGIQCDW